MVGEIRDLETAEIAIKAAQTGHLVLSTLHTNSASETITRLLNMGVPAFNVASSVNLITFNDWRGACASPAARRRTTFPTPHCWGRLYRGDAGERQHYACSRVQ
ncbi:MAG: ATPase, T2SS/T4P/T4SS family [Halioglobus sp.]